MSTKYWRILLLISVLLVTRPALANYAFSYYPFGLQTNQGNAYPTLSERLPQLYLGYIAPTLARRDLYNGKEIQTAAGTDYLNYGFRQYDPTTARWLAVDPKAEKYYIASPFSYCINTPILLYPSLKRGSSHMLLPKVDLVRCCKRARQPLPRSNQCACLIAEDAVGGVSNRCRWAAKFASV